jgi:hypothetical protein
MLIILFSGFGKDAYHIKRDWAYIPVDAIGKVIRSHCERGKKNYT